MHHGDDRRRGYASPPCSLHDRDDSDPAHDVPAWRRAERERLYAVRRAIGRAERAALDAGIALGLDALLGEVGDRCIAVYWPIRGEPDLHDWYARCSERGARLALPVVGEKQQPLTFRRYVPGARLVPGAWNIPVPADPEQAVPDVILSPLVGFDDARHRLGNGGGYYDRTLAAYAARPMTVGVGYARCRIRTIYPQPHDVPMDVIVTDAGVEQPT